MNIAHSASATDGEGVGSNNPAAEVMLHARKRQQATWSL